MKGRRAEYEVGRIVGGQGGREEGKENKMARGENKMGRRSVSFGSIVAGGWRMGKPREEQVKEWKY